MSLGEKELYEFGSFRLDVSEHTFLRIDGKLIATLPEKAFQTLCILVQNRGHLLTKQELLDKIWPDTAVEENNLNKSIHAIRHALGEDPRDQKYIETVLKHGYRFIADVRVVSDSLSQPRVTPSGVHAIVELVEWRNMIERVETQNEPLMLTNNVGDAIDIKQKHKQGLAVALIVLLSAVIGLGYWFFASRTVITGQIESIAVMPFVNESGNADIEYLSDGITETLIRSLSQLPNLIVKARSSVFRFKGKETAVQTIGEELNVQAILNGRVIQRGDQLTLIVELIDAQTENVIWTERYDRQRADLISLQSEIARDVSQKLRKKLSGADEQKLAKHYTENFEAYQLYLQGRFYWNQRRAENIRKATELFKAAAVKDPNYALAYVGLADCYVLMPDNMGTPASEADAQAKVYALRALEIDDSLAEAHATMGLIYRHERNLAEAEKEFKRAIELNPNYATAHHWYSRHLRTVKRLDEALVEIKLARELDPLSQPIMINIVQVYIAQGNLEAAFEQLQKIIAFNPEYATAHSELALVLLKKGLFNEALVEAQKGVDLAKRSHLFLDTLGKVYIGSGNRNEALAVIKELEGKHAKREASSYSIASLYAGLGEREHVFTWLDKALAEKNTDLNELNDDAIFEPFRDDQRFKKLLLHIGGLG